MNNLLELHIWALSGGAHKNNGAFINLIGAIGGHFVGGTMGFLEIRIHLAGFFRARLVQVILAQLRSLLWRGQVGERIVPSVSIVGTVSFLPFVAQRLALRGSIQVCPAIRGFISGIIANAWRIQFIFGSIGGLGLELDFKH